YVFGDRTTYHTHYWGQTWCPVDNSPAGSTCFVATIPHTAGAYDANMVATETGGQNTDVTSLCTRTLNSDPTLDTITCSFPYSSGHWVEGRNQAVFHYDGDNNGSKESTISSTFNIEPNIFDKTVDGAETMCEWLDSYDCLSPFPSDYVFTASA